MLCRAANQPGVLGGNKFIQHDMEASAIADALYSRIVMIPGGRDIEERPIILIDAELTSRVANEQLEKILKYFSSIFRYLTKFIVYFAPYYKFVIVSLLVKITYVRYSRERSLICSTDTRRLGLCMIINSQKTTWRVTRLILQRVTEIFSTELTTIIILRPEAFWDKQKVENCARLKHYHGVSKTLTVIIMLSLLLNNPNSEFQKLVSTGAKYVASD